MFPTIICKHLRYLPLQQGENPASSPGGGAWPALPRLVHFQPCHQPRPGFISRPCTALHASAGPLVPGSMRF